MATEYVSGMKVITIHLRDADNDEECGGHTRSSEGDSDVVAVSQQPPPS